MVVPVNSPVKLAAISADHNLCKAVIAGVGTFPDNNSFVVANQWTFIENSNKRPDVILFMNGLPVVLIELKSPSREETDASEGYLQIRNYMQEIPSMFIYNCICVISDHLTSKAGEDRFMEWKTKDGSYENTQYAQFDTFFEGMFTKERLLDIIKNFICFSNEGLKKFKILAGYHQYFAVNKAIESTKHATLTDGKGGVFWHTQGSGKSLSMVFYAHLLQDALDSPTIVVITDRNDLDDQLYGQFAKCKNFLRQEPVHATCRKLTETSGKNDMPPSVWRGLSLCLPASFFRSLQLLPLPSILMRRRYQWCGAILGNSFLICSS